MALVDGEKGDPVRVSVIVTVLNEAQSLPALLDSLEQQSTLPDEIVLVDGGSVDGSWELLQQHEGNLPLRMFQEPGTTIAQGRNSAIAEATGEIIAVTDAGVQLPLRWLEELLRPFESAETQAVAGFFRAAPTTLFELTLGATTLPALKEVNPASFLPSSRSVAFTKAAWDAAGGYPDWLDYCEDLVFDLRLRSLGVRFVWAPLAEARYRPRTSLWAFFRQYYHYARGDGKADLWLKRHLIRYGAYLAGLLLFWGAFSAPLLWAPLAVGVVGYCYQPYRRLWPWLGELPWHKRLVACALAPVLRVAGDVAKMLGYPAGVWWRWRHRAQLGGVR